LSKRAGWVSEQDSGDLRQAAEEFSAAVADAVALAERVKLLQEELIAQVNEQTGNTPFVLTVVTVLALPINLVAGLFGMNVGGIPFSQVPHGFVVVVATTLLLTGVPGLQRAQQAAAQLVGPYIQRAAGIDQHPPHQL
jgi:zinc transporter